MNESFTRRIGNPLRKPPAWPDRVTVWSKLRGQWSVKTDLANLRAVTRSEPGAGLESEVATLTRLNFGEVEALW